MAADIAAARGAETSSSAEHAKNDAAEARALRVALLVRVKGLADAHFDRFLEPNLRAISAQSWTPLEVAARASQWFTELRIKSVVDIGSGVGKFCIAAALGSRCRFIGVERHSRLVEVAGHLARLFSVERQVEFISGVFGEMPLPNAECYYLFNPFGDSSFDLGDHLHEAPDSSRARYIREVSEVELLLRALPAGAYVLTYNGFGGTLPDDFEEVRVDFTLPCVLRLSRRGREDQGHGRRAGRVFSKST
jgi:SAM-dependent methyltransferase